MQCNLVCYKFCINMLKTLCGAYKSLLKTHSIQITVKFMLNILYIELVKIKFTDKFLGEMWQIYRYSPGRSNCLYKCFTNLLPILNVLKIVRYISLLNSLIFITFVLLTYDKFRVVTVYFIRNSFRQDNNTFHPTWWTLSS